MRHHLRFAATALSVPLFVAIIPTAATSVPAGCGPAWSVVSSPNVDGRANVLMAVAATSATDAWSVGWYAVGHQGFRALAERWNGSAWSVVSTPEVGTLADFLFGVTSGPAQGTWAVGQSREGSDPQTPAHALILRWDGVAWHPSPAAELPVRQNSLQAIAASPAGELWAVGEASTGGPNPSTRPLAERWDGSSWDLVPVPALPGDAGFSGVAVVSASDVWALGWRFRNGVSSTLMEHWNGSAWTVVPTPSRPGQTTVMRAISAASATEVWAAGYTSPDSHPGGYRPIAERWGGTSWTASFPPPLPRRSLLLGVAALAPGQALAVGQGVLVTNGGEVTLIERWNGTSWSIESSPSPGPAYNVLYATASAGGRTWAVGGYDNATGHLRTLVEESCSA